jgi:hypothetical protein
MVCGGVLLFGQENRPTEQSNILTTSYDSVTVENSTTSVFTEIMLIAENKDSVTVNNKTVDIVYVGSTKPLLLNPELTEREKTVQLDRDTINPRQPLVIESSITDFNVETVKIYIEVDGETQYIKLPVE